ncbi:MAG: DUF4325 domain-containing protein [Proteobacteria bacterium]|nr:DUF4325 domain-containing protein [Pseudomonadota bacterium]MBU1708754.1 DUF4325 domain-containing protein [Pseudomonadota bacterium]
MHVKEKILALIKKKKAVSGVELAADLGISRQAVNKHLKNLIQNGSVFKEGITRGAVYRIATTGKSSPGKLRKTFILEDLAEDIVFRDISLFLNLPRILSPGAAEIARYTFTEMLNNAIDHSRSEKCHIEILIDEFNFQFCIRDYGVGIFYSVSDKFKLQDENAAVGEIIKGKTTTMKEKHSGEGIFFSSKAADTMSFRSHKTRLVFDNLRKDVFIEEKKNINGTEVFFCINKRTRKKLDSIFSMYAPEEFDYKFEKTRAMVKLFQPQYISRSEAKRLLHGLDKFKLIILDFKGVNVMGQGFADEIFRVFIRNHPDISIETENLSPALMPIIKHVVDN